MLELLTTQAIVSSKENPLLCFPINCFIKSYIYFTFDLGKKDF